MNADQSRAIRHDRAFSKLIENAGRHWEARRQAVAAQRELILRHPHPFTIALSSQAGTQGTSVAKEVGSLLDWHVYDHDLLEQIAHEMGLRSALLESLDERQRGWLRDSIQASLATLVSGEAAPWASRSSYLHHLIETVHSLGAHGECVIVGRGAAFILPVETTVRVHLVGPVNERVAALSRLRDISERDAAHQVRTIDRERNDFIRDHFFKDASDPSHYDLVLNAPRLSITQTAELIVDTLRRLQARGIEQRTERPSLVDSAR